ncbi:MAG TPA: TetR/AcrR family transcriptional regulator [Thermoanaerobaculia bacterium]
MPTSPTTLFADERAGSIYRTAARIIYTKGFEAASMSEIAKAVDLTKAGLYYYVKGKGELLFAIMSFAMDLLDREVIAPAQRIGDPGERLRAIVEEHSRLLTYDEGALVILMDEVGSLSPEHRSRITERKRSYFEFVRDTLDELAAAGRLHAVDTTVAAFSLLGMVMWLARWYAPGGRLAAREVVRDITEIALRGVLREGRPEAVSAASSAVYSEEVLS